MMASGRVLLRDFIKQGFGQAAQREQQLAIGPPEDCHGFGLQESLAA